MLKRIWRKVAPNPLDRLLKRAFKKKQRTFLIAWNRGLGDIALGLFALVYRIRQFIPHAEITFITRPDLKEGFALLKDVDVIVAEDWKRGEVLDLLQTLEQLDIDPEEFDVIIEKPDPTYWVKWQLGTLVPRLNWLPHWDTFCQRFGLSPEVDYIGVHVQTETNYGYQKNWPISYWEHFFQKVSRDGQYQLILFGFEPKPLFAMPGIVDLRGKTTLLEMLSIVKNRCRYLIVPDSGVLSLTYFLAESFPLHIVSLWADPEQGVLKQNVASPNPQLSHVPLIAKEQDVSQISVEAVLERLYKNSGIR